MHFEDGGVFSPLLCFEAVSAERIVQLDVPLTGKFFDLALAGIEREYPNKPGHVLLSDKDVRSPRELHPVFYGHFDWHSSVHGHWSLVRLLKLSPGHERAEEVRKVLDRRFTAEGLLTEAKYLGANKSFERMYGWAWALRLALELRTWDDEQGRSWTNLFTPIEAAIVKNAQEYLPKLDWPIRCGFHPESAFPMAQMLDYARGTGDRDLESLVADKCRVFYAKDKNYPVIYEPSGNDFFSSGFNEADLMRRILPEERFGAWLAGFFPGLEAGQMGNLLDPVAPCDLQDGHLVHLVGLNLSRAWTMRAIARSLPRANDRRKEILLEAARRHAEAGLQQVFSGSYEGEHWLGSFAVYLLSETGE